MYVFVLSALYTLTFPIFVLVDYAPPPQPRSCKDYIQATRRRRGTRSGPRVRFNYTEMLETPNTLTSPALHYPAPYRLELTKIMVDCVGSAAAKGLIANTPVNLRWTADVTLIGDRET